MAKLNRFTMPVFAGNAAQNETSVFGTMKTSPQYTTDVAVSIDTTAYGNGWSDAIEIGYAPFMEDMNTLQRAITYQIAYSQQEGIPEWASDTTYYKDGLAKLSTGNGAQIYVSLVDDNIGNLVSDTTKWKLVLDTANSYVTTNTAQTITGAKTFNDVQVLNGATLKCFNFERGTNPQTTQYVNLYTTDSTATIGDNTALGLFRTRVEANGNVTTLMRAFKNNTAGTNNTADIQVIYPASGNPYATAPTPTDTTTTSGTQIATTGWVNTVGNNVVHRTGDESITGRKNFVGGYNNVRLSCTTNDTTGNNNYTDIAFYNNSGSTKNAYIRANNLGNLYLSATDAVTAPASDKADSILITVAKLKAQNGYFKLGNGLIIQWGRTQIDVVTGGSHTPTTITLPIAFSGTNFSFTGTFEQNTSTSPSNTDDVSFCTTSITTTNVKGFGYDSGGNTYKAYLRWIAIGY